MIVAFYITVQFDQELVVAGKIMHSCKMEGKLSILTLSPVAICQIKF